MPKRKLLLTLAGAALLTACATEPASNTIAPRLMDLGRFVSAAKPPANNALYAWMPADTVDNSKTPVSAMASHIEQAITRTAYTLDMTFKRQQDSLNYSIISPKHGCTTITPCAIHARVGKPGFVQPPATEIPAYWFSGAPDSTLEINTHPDTRLPVALIYKTISTYMPEWAYLHIAHGKSQLITGQRIEAAYLLNKGRAHFYSGTPGLKPPPIEDNHDR